MASIQAIPTHDSPDLHARFTACSAAFAAQPLPELTDRKQWLSQLRHMVLAHQEALIEATRSDFSARSADEVRLAEIMPTLAGISYASKHLSAWMRPETRKTSLLFQPGKNQILWQPKGVVGIIAPWNYPINLVLGPLTAALAAGNRVLIKVSEYTPATSALLAELLSACFDADHVGVVQGDAEIAGRFAALPFDHLLFTGSTAVGRQVMAAAASNLTPVTLELGGKSPVIIDDDAELPEVARAVLFGKAFNAGQTCIAPDYVLCPEARIPGLIEALRQAAKAFYATPRQHLDYGAIISDRHHQRLQELLADAEAGGAERIELFSLREGGSRRHMPITLLQHTRADMRIREEEIFGPLLPIIPVENREQAIAHINAGARPLALYFFGHDREAQQQVLERTHSGGVCINDTLVHFAQDDLPFGGIGDSGMGHYHGKEGFLTFSHPKSVHRKGKVNSGKLIYPPYGRLIHKLVYRLFIR